MADPLRQFVGQWNFARRRVGTGTGFRLVIVGRCHRIEGTWSATFLVNFPVLANCIDYKHLWEKSLMNCIGTKCLSSNLAAACFGLIGALLTTAPTAQAAI